MPSKRTGDWKAFRRLKKDLQRANSVMLEGAKLGMRQAVLKVEARVVLHLEKQDLPWKPLDPAYKRLKQKKGLSTNILIATGTLMNSVTSDISSDGMTGFVGVNRKTAKKKKGVDPVLIGAVMEFGSKKRNIPARPLFKPTLEEMTGEIERTLMQNIKSAITKIT